MEQRTETICLTMTDLAPEHGVYTLQAAAKLLSELQVGRQERDFAISWKLAPPDCGSRQGIVLCGRVKFRSQWQFQAYLDYIQKRICDMMDDRKVSCRLSTGSCQENGG